MKPGGEPGFGFAPIFSEAALSKAISKADIFRIYPRPQNAPRGSARACFHSREPCRRPRTARSLDRTLRRLSRLCSGTRRRRAERRYGRTFAHVRRRVDIWINPWKDYQNAGYQLVQSLVAIASGGLFGKGTEDAFLKNLGAANTDLVFGVISEEFGLILALCCVFVLLVLAVYAVRRSVNARSSYYVIAANSAAECRAFCALMKRRRSCFVTF